MTKYGGGVAGGGSSVYYYSQDGLGSVRTITDASALIANKYDYTAFGEKYAANTAENIVNRYCYTGREKSTFGDNGAPMYYRWRRYDSDIGRFIHRDPLGYKDGIAIYLYVKNSPLLHTDMFGLRAMKRPPKNLSGFNVGWSEWGGERYEGRTPIALAQEGCKERCKNLTCPKDGGHLKRRLTRLVLL